MRKKTLILLLAVSIVMVFSYREAMAAANGDGSCDATELANYTCGNFGTGNVIEYRGSSSGSCDLTYGTIPPNTTEPCTVYFYKYTGISQNQIDVAIPIQFTQVLNDERDIDCGQWITGGSGDPTTGFAVGMITLGVCRIPASAASLPVVTTDPGDWNIWIATDPSSVDKSNPLSWQVRYSKNAVYSAAILGPNKEQKPIVEIGGALLDKKGDSVEYTVDGDTVTIVSSTSGAQALPINSSKICGPTTGSTYNFIENGIKYDCHTINYVSEGCEIYTPGTWHYIESLKLWIYF